ncbi:hypothetical protein LTR36_005397 [Oleoguttula mirabilis]|uniref:Uncharacterized protein n=1 Tax=Oleoguttula mirabilis TaxID=1507867 RepID=A0AAV9JEQ8_9PEZI|nr:hypothetical protein LTR36_005397 [Oleoguttula mirabilis]
MARSWKSRASGNTLRVPSNKENRSTTLSESDLQPSGYLLPKAAPVLGEIAPNNQALRTGPWRPRPSPTPSLRKKKIESLVKAHGSPTHVRVTAGGRIVPSDQSPLCHPRYGYSAIKTNGGLVKFAPNHPMGNAQWTQATQNGFVAQDVNGRLCQIVDGTVLPLNEIDGALQLFMPAPNLNITRRGPSLNAIPGPFGPNDNPQKHQSSRIVPPEPSVSSQINALELEYAKREHELRDVDKTEVLHGRTMGKAARDALIGKRRELVVTLDNIRRALKGLKEQAPANASTSPIAVQQRQSISQPKPRLPAFLQQRRPNQSMAMPPAPPALYGPFYAAPQRPPFAAPYAIQPNASPTSVPSGFGSQSWAVPPPAMFAPPHPFDGSMSTTSLSYQPERFNPHTSYPPRPEPIAPVQAPPVEQRIPQSDGACSFTDLQKVSPSHKSHALPIKAPESKGLKSVLNPMSPVYKPGTGLIKDLEKGEKPAAKSIKDRAPTPLSVLHQLLPPSTGPLRVVNTTDETTSPTKKSTLLHSSSVASFDTADFFPRNTREYSTRRQAYTSATEQSEDKENTDPQRHDSKQAEPPITPGKERPVTHGHPVIVRSVSSGAASPSTAGYKAPTAPPGAPVDPEANQQRVSLKDDGTSWERQSHGFDVSIVPDRQAHNISPKIKRRDWLFVEERPGQPASSPEKYQHPCEDELCVTSSPYDNVDFMNKPRDFIEGYQSGLHRNPPGFNRSADFLEGYCAALMKAKAPVAKIAPSTGSPVKPTSRRPSPVSVPSQSSSTLQVDRRPARPTLAPFETNIHSMDTLKQAVFAPQNENAILTPATDGPHVNEAQFNLGAWAKSHNTTAMADVDPTALANALAGFQFPQRTASAVRRQLHNSSDDHLGPMGETKAIIRGQEAAQSSPMPLLQAQNQVAPPPASPSMSAKSIPSSTATATDHRISSMTSIDSNLYRNWPGTRAFSPHLEWKSASSVAQHTGFANGFFAHAQFDGTSGSVNYMSETQLTQGHITVGAPAPQTQRPMSIMSDNTGVQHPQTRFREASLDGMSSPAKSPHLVGPRSSPMSPKISPSKDRAKDSPTKGSSPARATFEHIAEKVGIKVANTSEPSSPQGKRRGWRDVWRGSSRKETSKDDIS